MRANRFMRALIALPLCLAVISASAATSVDALLKKADSIRSSDPPHLNRILQQLDKVAGDATPAQLQQLRLLHAYRLIFAGDSEGSILELKRLLEENPGTDLRYRAGALLVNNYAATGQFSEGLAELGRALPLQKLVRDRDIRHQGLLAASILYNQVGQYDLSRHYADQLLSEPASGRTQCFAGSMRVEALQRRGTAPSDELIMAVIRQCRAQNEGIVTGLVRSYLARKWYTEGRVGNAIDLLERHLDEIEATRYPRLTGEVHALLAEYHLANGDYAAAQRYAQRAIAPSVRSAYSLPLVTAYKVLFDIDMRRKDAVAALEHYRNYTEADRAYLNEVKARELAFQLARHETLQKNQQIELLNRKNQVLQLQQRVDRQATQNTQLLAALLAILLATIGYWAYKMKRMQTSFRRMAETDALTGISNRHHFTHQAEEALAYCARTGEDVCLVMFDLDNFKTINDRYGHVTGDHVLKQVADACKARCRKNDRIGRLGGEEFALLLIGCDLDRATQMAHTCCARIAEIDTHETGHHFPVTASFGVTAASLSGYDLTKLLSHADQMLYRSKDEGRNRVSVFAPAGPEVAAAFV